MEDKIGKENQREGSMRRTQSDIAGFENRGRGDFPGGPVVKNWSCNAGDTSSIPGRGTKIPPAAGQ